MTEADASNDNTCYFCGESLGKHFQIHHKMPRRYFRKGGADFDGNPVKVHYRCHASFHRLYDNPTWTIREFNAVMQPLDYGRLIFPQ